MTLADGTQYHSTWQGNSELEGLGVYTNPRWEEGPLRAIDVLLARHPASRYHIPCRLLLPIEMCVCNSHPYAQQALADTLNRQRFNTSKEGSTMCYMSQ